jgi:hypothetical protein
MFQSRGAQLTKLYKVASNIFIQFLQFFFLHTEICISSLALGRKHHITASSIRILDPQYGPCFLSPFWHLDFGKICGSLFLKNHSAFIFRVSQSLEMKALWSLETSRTAERTKQHYIPDKLNLQNQRYHNYVLPLLAEF